MYDEYGDYVDQEGDYQGEPWTDNGDGSVTNPDGYIYDIFTGEYLGELNNDGTWTDIYGQQFTGDNQPINDGYIDNGDGTYTSIYTGETLQGGGTLGDGTPANEPGLGGGNVNYDPDDFGDVYTVNGIWVGNIFGLAQPGTSTPTPGVRSPGNTPGGAYKPGGALASSSGSSSTGDLVRQLQQLLTAARSSNAPTSQQAAISAALANAQKSAGLSTTEKFAIAGGALLALYAFSQRHRVA